jgi:hypothetical protein
LSVFPSGEKWNRYSAHGDSLRILGLSLRDCLHILQGKKEFCVIVWIVQNTTGPCVDPDSHIPSAKSYLWDHQGNLALARY